MPEGDSIHRLAARIGPFLTGRIVKDFTAHRIADAAAQSVIGHRIVAVEARGKNLLVRFDDARVLLVHLRMHGRIRVERSGTRSAFWSSSPSSRSAEMRLDVEGAAIVGRQLPVCRLLTASQEKRIPALARLGPDLLGEAPDDASFGAAVLRRFKAQEPRLLRRDIADVLLDQRTFAGIGNVYKSEVLFLEGVHPRASAATLPDAVILGLYRRARSLLQQNVGRGPRTTRRTLTGARLWVYGRGGRPCFRCYGTITRIVIGPNAGRSTYLCERCQPLVRPS